MEEKKSTEVLEEVNPGGGMGKVKQVKRLKEVSSGENMKKIQRAQKKQNTKKRRSSIGHIGKTIVFETSDKKILNFSKMQRTVKGRWASHSRINKKPRKQFLGPDSDQITFTITLNAEHGVKPRKTIENIEKLIRTGTPQTVVIGKKKVGSNKFVITEMSESWERILNKGEVVKITCELTLEEYI